MENMELESIVQPGAPILQPVQPDPLEGTLNLPARASAEGGFGVIYKGTWIRNGEESIVCIKCLRMNVTDLPERGLSKEQRLQRRIRREALVWGSADHPNIYPYLGYQVVGEQTWLVSPWTESGSLDVYLYRNQNLDYAAKLKLLKDAAQGLAYLHGQTPPIAHGDLSAGNVLIRITENVATATLCDFGLSRVMSEFQTNLTTSGGTLATIGYSAIELLNGNTLPSPMSDVWAFAGVMLFAMSGKRPFYHHRIVATTIFAIARNEQPQPMNHPDLPENDPLWQFMRQCWNPIPTERPKAEGVVARLAELIAGN